MLPVAYMESELVSEKLLLAVVNADNSRLLTRSSIPLSVLQPHRHYNLKLAMTGQQSLQTRMPASTHACIRRYMMRALAIPATCS